MSSPTHLARQQSFSAGAAKSPSTLTHRVDHAKTGPDPSTPVSDSTTQPFFYMALHDFVGQSHNELSVRKGDVLRVIEKNNTGNFHSLRP